MNLRRSVLVTLIALVVCHAAPQAISGVRDDHGNESPAAGQLRLRFSLLASTANASLGRSLFEDDCLKRQLSEMIRWIQAPIDQSDANVKAGFSNVTILKNGLQQINDGLCFSDVSNQEDAACNGGDDTNAFPQSLLISWQEYLKANNVTSHLLANITLPFLEYIGQFKNDKAYRKLNKLRGGITSACQLSHHGWSDLDAAIKSSGVKSGNSERKPKGCQSGPAQCRRAKQLLACFVYHAHLIDAVPMICNFIQSITRNSASESEAFVNSGSLKIFKNATSQLLDSISTHSLPKCVCQTTTCRKFAELLKRQINTSANPCEDFYGFACGGFVSRHPIATLTEMEDQLNGKFAPGLCKEMPRLIVADEVKRAIHEALAAVDVKTLQARGHFRNDSLAVANQTVVYELLGELMGKLNIAPLIRLRIFGRLFLLEPSGFGSLVEFADEQVYVHRVETVKKSLKTLAAAVDESATMSDMTINVTAHQVVRMEKTLALLTKPDFNRTNHNTHYLNFSAVWETKPELRPFLANAFRQDQRLYQSDEYQVLFVSLAFVERVSKLTRDLLSRRTLLHMIMVRMLEKLAFIFDEDLSDPLAEYVSSAEGLVITQLFAEEQRRRKREDVPETAASRCLNETREHFPEAIDRLFIVKNFLGEKQVIAAGMVESMKEAAKGIFVKSSLLTSSKTQERFLRKLDKMITHVGFHRSLLNDSLLNQKSSKRLLTTDYFDTLVLHFMKWDYARIDDVIDPREFLCKPVTTAGNACYAPGANSLTVPAGNFEFPLFDASLPSPIHYGLLGFIIGHEIFHGFDENGVTHGEDGVKKRSLHLFRNDAVANGTFRERCKCLRDDANDNFCYNVDFHIYDPDEVDEIEAAEPVENVSVTSTSKPSYAPENYNDGAWLTTGFSIKEPRFTDENVSCVRYAQLGEIMADQNGLKAALGAMLLTEGSLGSDIKLPGLEHYSSQQLLHLAFATFFCEPFNPLKLALDLTDKPHPPSDARVNLAVRHSPEFAQAFSCKAGDRLALPRNENCEIY